MNRPARFGKSEGAAPRTATNVSLSAELVERIMNLYDSGPTIAGPIDIVLTGV